MAQNLLAQETSPYLLQHKDNPVHWHPWNPDALEIARRENKPILLSIGYAACHWCHVMAHESFEDAAIATQMNDLFVNIKVDREERPDLDVIYQMALALMGEPGGWPLTMFLTPEGTPFWGGTYFPATPRYGRPAFPDVLSSVSSAFHDRAQEVARSATALREAIAQLSHPDTPGELTRDRVDEAAAQALRMIDPIHGGTTGAPKFPQVPLFRFLWQVYRRTGSALYRDAVTTTLERMCQGGIYDHLGGGFSRYSTDEVWLAPHFEKMLYDNALLIDLLTEAWKETRSPLYAERIAETVAWTLRDMTVADPEAPDGPFGLASAFDADSEGEEGRYYVWTEDEIDSLLGSDSPIFKESYDVTLRGNWEGKTILNRSRGTRSFGMPAVEAKLAECRDKLLKARASRVPPLQDDKVLADWNGLMVAALAHAGAVFDRPDWIDAARSVFAFVCNAMVSDGRMLHSWRAGRPRHPAVLDDYAQMARAALALHEVTAETPYLDQAEAWVAEADRHYWDPDGGAYFLTADHITDVITRTKTIADTACPSGNGIMAEVLARLAQLTGKMDYADRARELVAVFAGGTPPQLLNHPTLLTAFEVLDTPVQVVVVGPPDDPATEALFRAALETAPPSRILTCITPDDDLPPDHPAQGKGLQDGQPTAYLCVGPTCTAPLTDPQALRSHLANPSGDT